MCISVKPDKFADQRPWDGPFNGDPSELDYITTDYCDDSRCDSKPKQLGTMYHARGATGRVCPVLFLCCKHAFKDVQAA